MTYANECYRAAALAGSVNAQYIFGKRRFDEGKFWQQWRQGIYGLPVHETYAKQMYEEGFIFLKKAIENGSFLAKRLYGLAYIHGLGVAKDQDQGFKLIIQSVDDEKAWDKATKIFEELGLNTPEFFSSIMALRANSARS
jgi:TPR repeat protein